VTQLTSGRQSPDSVFDVYSGCAERGLLRKLSFVTYVIVIICDSILAFQADVVLIC